MTHAWLIRQMKDDLLGQAKIKPGSDLEALPRFNQVPVEAEPCDFGANLWHDVRNLNPTLASRTMDSSKFRSGQACASRFDHDKCSRQAITKSIDNTHDSLTEPSTRATWKTNESNSCRLMSSGIRKQAEVFVFGQEQPRLGTR